MVEIILEVCGLSTGLKIQGRHPEKVLENQWCYILLPVSSGPSLRSRLTSYMMALKCDFLVFEQLKRFGHWRWQPLKSAECTKHLKMLNTFGSLYNQFIVSNKILRGLGRFLLHNFGLANPRKLLDIHARYATLLCNYVVFRWHFVENIRAWF